MARVIVVDDEQLVRELYSIWLENAGYQVVAVDSAEAGRAALASAQAEVLLTDIRMTTAAEGIDLLAWARRHDPTISVVLITGVPEVSTAVEALRLAAYDYLVKPVPHESLLRVIARAADHCSLQRERSRLEEENRRFQQHLQQLVEERTQALERRTSQLVLLNRVVREISALEEDAREIVNRAVTSLERILGYQGAAVFEIDRTTKTVQLLAGSDGYSTGQRAHEMDWLMSEIVLASDPLQSSSHPDRTEGSAAIRPAGSEKVAVFPITVGGLTRYFLVLPAINGVGLDAADTTVISTLTEHLGTSLANANLYSQLRSALLVREQILQNVSHELRTPLTLISGYTELLAERGSLPDNDDMLNIIIEQTDHLSYLVNQLLTFQSIESDQVVMDLLVVNQWIESLAVTWRPILERSGLHLRVEDDEKPTVIQGNWDQLNEAMQNLMDNARKFSPQGGTVTISISRNDKEVVISITDQGIGVSPEKLPQLFERFYQADAGVTRRFGGMGIGLALVREIVAVHGGRVWAQSPGEGAGFTVSLAMPVVV